MSTLRISSHREQAEVLQKPGEEASSTPTARSAAPAFLLIPSRRAPFRLLRFSPSSSLTPGPHLAQPQPPKTNRRSKPDARTLRPPRCPRTFPVPSATKQSSLADSFHQFSALLSATPTLPLPTPSGPSLGASTGGCSGPALLALFRTSSRSRYGFVIKRE